MSAATVAVITIVVVFAIAATVLFPHLTDYARHGRLRRRFGPEYERLSWVHGDPRAAARELAEREDARRSLTLRQLGQPERLQYQRAWATVQERFVDDPRDAADQADQAIGRLLTDLGYPDGDRDRQLALASVDHPRAVFEYRQGHELAGSSDTEELRQAMLRFRVLYDDLVEAPRRAPALLQRR